LKLFVIMSRAKSSKAAKTLHVESLTVNPDGSLSVQVDDAVQNFTAKEWDGVSIIKYPDRISSATN
jgi:hypothetical protein